MKIRRKRLRGALVAGVATAIGALAVAPGAFAHEGEFAQFNRCPSTNQQVQKCLHSVTESGEVILGSKTVPITNPVTLQGGYSEPNGEGISSFVGATNGETLSRAPQNVPGGLLGIVPPEQSPWLVKLLSRFFFENNLTGVDSTLELSRPASQIQISERNLLFRQGVALSLPVKVHLENPFLGRNCYVGSSSSPIDWQLTTGTTSPPAPNEPIKGKVGTFEPKAEGFILQISGNELVDNAWSAPGAQGCGGILSFLVDPVVNLISGFPSAAGNNKAVLANTLDIALAGAVNEH